ncbi:MAG TPA: hypothetical protein VGY56_08455 [Verrucomicrobiae bacterium]|nr:hypothetical protein [Verrucomicrobiae bacterium]
MKVLRLKVKEEKRQSLRAQRVKIQFRFAGRLEWTTISGASAALNGTNYVSITRAEQSFFFRIRKT